MGRTLRRLLGIVVVGLAVGCVYGPQHIPQLKAQIVQAKQAGNEAEAVRLQAIVDGLEAEEQRKLQAELEHERWLASLTPEEHRWLIMQQYLQQQQLQQEQAARRQAALEDIGRSLNGIQFENAGTIMMRQRSEYPTYRIVRDPVTGELIAVPKRTYGY